MSGATGGDGASLLGLGTWLKQGPATLVLRDDAWVVLVPGLRKQVVEAAWEVLGEKPAPEEFLDRLVEAGGLGSADKLTALLFGFHDGTRAVFGVKGTTPIAVYTADGSQQIAGTEDEPFVLRTLEGVRRTAFGDLPPEESLGGARLMAGIVPVRGFVHVTIDPAALEESERAALAAQVDSDGRSIEDPEAEKRRAARPAPTPRPSSSTAAPRVLTPATATRKPGELPPSAARGGSPGTSTRSAAAEPAPTGPNMFDSLFGGSAPKPAEATPAVPAAAPAPPAAAPAAPAAAAATSTDSEATSADVASDAAGSATTRDEATAAVPPAVKRRLVSTSLFDRRRRGPSSGAAAEVPAPPVATADAPAPSSTPRAAHEHEFVSPDTQVAPIDDAELDEESAPAPRPARPPRRTAGPAPAVSDLENTGAYDDLFGKTVFRRIEDAAVRRAEEDADEEQETGSSAPEVTAGSAPDSPESAEPAAPSTPAEPAPQPAPDSGPGEFIDWVPGVGRAAPEVAQTAARRASAPPTPEPAYPQVHMAERPPAPITGSRPAPTAPPAPYEQAGRSRPFGGPMSTGAAGQQLGDPAPYEQAGRFPTFGGPVNPATAGHQVGFPAPQRGGAPGAGHPSAPGGAAHGGGPAQQTPPPQARPPAGGHPHAPRPAPQPASSAGPSGPVMGGAVALPGLVCANGHANSPERAVCRVCGAPLQGATRTVARPPLGAVRFSHGERFVLDRSAIIGRRPRASRVSGNDVPQLITVPSPQQDISRSHLELRLEGWHVVALDLATTNGTTLYREGFEPVRLRAREGVVLHDGDQLDLGDDVHLTFGERV